MSATKSPLGISSVSPCSTSTFCLPRSYTLVTLRTSTIASLMYSPLRVLSLPSHDFATRTAAPSSDRPARSMITALAGGTAGEHLPRIAASCRRASPLRRCAFCSCTTKTTFLIAVLAQRRARHQHALRRSAALRAAGLLVLEEGDAHAHVRHDALVLDSSPMRTLTVALERSAVGMMAMTCEGIFQSG